MQDARAQQARETAERWRIGNEERRAELLPRDATVAGWEALKAAARARFARIPAELRAGIPAIRARDARTIQRMIDGALDELERWPTGGPNENDPRPAGTQHGARRECAPRAGCPRGIVQVLGTLARLRHVLGRFGPEGRIGPPRPEAAVARGLETQMGGRAERWCRNGTVASLMTIRGTMQSAGGATYRMSLRAELTIETARTGQQELSVRVFVPEAPPMLQAALGATLLGAAARARRRTKG